MSDIYDEVGRIVAGRLNRVDLAEFERELRDSVACAFESYFEAISFESGFSDYIDQMRSFKSFGLIFFVDRPGLPVPECPAPRGRYSFRKK